MALLWVIFVALAGPQLGYGLPLKSTPQVYLHDASGPALGGWGWESAWYAALPAVALVVAGVALLLGCTWCYSHKDCKQPNEGTENQLFNASATHLQQDGRRSNPPDSGFSEPSTNNNISEDNNNGPISLREMQNIANNNAAAYIVSENEERNRNRESVVEFEPLPAPAAIGVRDPLERCADWFGTEDFPRNQLQYLREFARGWFGRVVETEMEVDGSTSIVAVKILNQNASLEDKARFLTEARVYRDARHENVLACRGHCLREDPWILIFDIYSMDLHQYLSVNRSSLETAEGGAVSLRLMCDVACALDHLHSRGFYAHVGPVCTQNVLIKETSDGARAVLGGYVPVQIRDEYTAPETRRNPPLYTASSAVWELGSLVWELSGGSGAPPHPPPPRPLAQHLYQVMQLCWNVDPAARPTAAQVHALLSHLRLHSHAHAREHAGTHHDAAGDFEERWQRLKPNTIPKCDEHVALVHAPSSAAPPADGLTVEHGGGHVSRSSSILSDRDDLAAQYKSESLNNLHGSFDDVRNIYLTHNETATLECHQGNFGLEQRHRDHSDASVDPWLKDIVSDSQDDVSYYRDVSDVIKNLDNILNSEKTSSSESSHQASPSRDNLSLDCKTDYQVQSSLVKSPGISNFQNILEMGFDAPQEKTPCEDDELDRDTIGTLSHSFERHSDTTSQHTLENLTPDTPNRDIDVVNAIESCAEAVQKDLEASVDNKSLESPKRDMPNDNKVDCSDKVAPPLKEICAIVANNSISEPKQINAIEDCETSCDSKVVETVRTDDEMETKSVDNITCEATEEETSVKSASEEDNQKHEVVDSNCKHSIEYVSTVANNVLPDLINDTLEIKILEKPSSPVNEDVPVISKLIDEEVVPVNSAVIRKPDVEATPTVNHSSNSIVSSQLLIENERTGSFIPENKTQEKSLNEFKDSFEAKENIINFDDNQSHLVGRTEKHEVTELSSSLPEKLPISNSHIPESVQMETGSFPVKHIEDVNAARETVPTIPLEEVQNSYKETIATTMNNSINAEKDSAVDVSDITKDERLVECEISDIRSETNKKAEHSNESTVYMDLNNTNSSNLVSEPLDDNVKKVVDSCLEKSNNLGECTIVNNESTIYLDLPSVIKDTDDFLKAEKVNSIQSVESQDPIFSSTPKVSDSSENTIENSVKDSDALSETKVPSDESGAAFNKYERKNLSDISPFESPTKSHPTDTYTDSVVLGPFENCSIELFKGGKCELVDLPKEELLAFSSNFSEMNLETPSPLRDANFLNEVPDVRFYDLSTSEGKQEKEHTENTDESDQPKTAKRVSPSTPPNSPGIFLASTSQEKYLVNIDLDTQTESVQSYAVESYPPIDCDSGLSSLQKEVDLNQIELTTKMAMAENENNMNIEYLGPLTVEGVVSGDDVVANDSDAFPEIVLAGNGGVLEEPLVMDEDCMKALRNELELKLPLAQVAAIEPAAESEPDSDPSWERLPPPPELVVQYGGPPALSPIQEETHHQLTAYENDAWNASTRTESSESYPEPCNNSTDEVTELPTGAAVASLEHSTYTLHSKNNTYTIQKDISSGNEMTMSADSLNGSPFKKPIEPLSPIDDRTYNKEDEKDSNCERISQVSPCIMSPTTEVSVPVDTENVDNATGASTLSKTTLPTDAKHSKPSECLSKATSIDSWCSNDTLYNVEENFDDLILDPDEQAHFENDNHEKSDSDSTDTLTHNDCEKDASHCSTYIIHDSKSEICDTFSPDSINANDNNTYTKPKTVTGTTEVNDSTKNTQTKDLAYGTLPSYSNCTTELMSGVEDPWKLPRPEMVRRSPLLDEVQMTPPRFVEDKEQTSDEKPRTKEATVKKMASVEMSCLQDYLEESGTNTSKSQEFLSELYDSPNTEMVPSQTSTPYLGQVDNEHAYKRQSIPLQLYSPESNVTSEPYSTELPELVSSNSDLAKTNNNLTKLLMEHTPNYLEFEDSALRKPQEVNSLEKSSQNTDGTENSGDFRQFESSARNRPQDMSSLINVCSLLLESERQTSGNISSLSNDNNLSSQQNTNSINQSNETEDKQIPNIINTTIPQIVESYTVPVNNFVDICVTDYDDENEQPHSIIITEVPIDYSLSPVRTYDSHTAHSNITTVARDVSKESPNRTFDSHIDFPLSYDSHEEVGVVTAKENKAITQIPQTNGVNEVGEILVAEVDDSLTASTATNDNTESLKNDSSSLIFDISGIKSTPSPQVKDLPNGSASEELSTSTKNTVTDVKCNGNSENENHAVINVLNEQFEELMERNASDTKNSDKNELEKMNSSQSLTDALKSPVQENESVVAEEVNDEPQAQRVNGTIEGRIVALTEDFLQNEKNFCQLDSYLPLLNDIRFTGPAAEIMSTSFTEESPTEPLAPACEQDSKQNAVSDIIKDWDSDSESHSSNSSSGEFIWKDGEGHETALVPNTHFDHQRGNSMGSGGEVPESRGAGEGAMSSGDSGSGSGSDGDEVEFVPSSWDCRAAPAKSSLRSLENAAATPDNKKRVVFKRQKYHCVYEYPREAADVEHSPAYLPDLSTYCEWDPSSAEEAELGYGQLFGGSPLDMYPLRAGIAFGADFDDDFFISSSTRPFESLGLMSSASQFFPGLRPKPAPAPAPTTRRLPSDLPAPLPHTTTELDFTTPDSGVEDITPGSTSTDEDFKKVPESEVPWRPTESGSSSESVSPSSPGGEALGGLRHTRDKLKLDLPPSPHVPSPRHSRVFSFTLDKPKRHDPPETPLVMTDDTPVVTAPITLPDDGEVEDVLAPEPTFSTFGKMATKTDDAEHKIVLDEAEETTAESSPSKEEAVVPAGEAVKGEVTAVDSADEDSGIESSAAAKLHSTPTCPR